MRQIIRNRQIVTDTWQTVGDDEPLPDAPVIVSFARWQAERDSLAAHDWPVGVRFKNDADLAALVPELPALALIALEFPAFKDGRALTQARLLRERYGFRGELRAVGDVLRDQLFFMERSGFDAFELRSDRSLEDALEAFTEFTVTYQPAADQPLPLYRRGR
jgi:uncharacterized protein (DUF934 family)